MGGSRYAGGWYLYGSNPYGRLPELERHRFRIRLHRLGLVTRLILVPQLILIPMLPRPLLPACLLNM